MQAVRVSSAVALSFWSLCFTANALAVSGRATAVFDSGRTVTVAGTKGEFSCAEGDLVFVFSEAVNGQNPPIEIRLNENDEERAQLSLTVTIIQSCGQGEATFFYRHDTLNGTLGEDLVIDPGQFSLSLPAAAGASVTETIDYRVLDDPESEDDEVLTLVGDRIVFFVNDTAGQTMGRRELARITIPANTDRTVNPGNVPGDIPLSGIQTITRFNNACKQARAGSAFDDLCREVADELSLDEDDLDDLTLTRQLIEALNPRETTETITVALTNIGRIQHSNILNRLNALRQGARGFDFQGIQLAMNGRTLNTQWIAGFFNADQAEQGTEAGGSRLLSQKWGAFLTGSVSVGDRELQTVSLEADFDIYDLTGGVDYRFDNGLILGAAVGITRFESEAGGADVDADSMTVQAFGTYNLTDRFYVDATAAYATGDIDKTRVVDLSGIGGLTAAEAAGSTDTSQFAASLAANYRAVIQNGWSLTTYGSLYFADTEIDSLREQGTVLALVFQDRNPDALLSSLGLRGAKVFNLRNGVLTAFADLAYRHESNDPVQVNTRFVATGTAGPTILLDDPDTDFGSLAAGLSWVFPSGNQIFVSVETLFADSVRNRYSFFIGGRYEF